MNDSLYGLLLILIACVIVVGLVIIESVGTAVSDWMRKPPENNS